VSNDALRAGRLPDAWGTVSDDSVRMTASTVAAAPLRLGVHALVAVAIGVVSPFTGLAGPVALLIGMVIGSTDAAQMRGERRTLADQLAMSFIVAVLVLLMLALGAIVGGLIALLVVGLTVFSEKVAAFASPTDRGVARILLFLVPVLMWLVVFPLIGMNVQVRIGG
jgi:hypothetical protein